MRMAQESAATGVGSIPANGRRKDISIRLDVTWESSSPAASLHARIDGVHRKSPVSRFHRLLNFTPPRREFRGIIVAKARDARRSACFRLSLLDGDESEKLGLLDFVSGNGKSADQLADGFGSALPL